MSSSTIAIIVGAVAAIAVLSSWVLSRRRFTKRSPARMEELHAELADRISFEAFSEVLAAVGRAYSVDARLLRPEDSIESLLNMDSWTLNAGTERLNEWLVRKGIREITSRSPTLLELMELVEDRNKHANSA